MPNQWMFAVAEDLATELDRMSAASGVRRPQEALACLVLGMQIKKRLLEDREVVQKLVGTSEAPAKLPENLGVDQPPPVPVKKPKKERQPPSLGTTGEFDIMAGTDSPSKAASPVEPPESPAKPVPPVKRQPVAPVEDDDEDNDWDLRDLGIGTGGDIGPNPFAELPELPKSPTVKKTEPDPWATLADPAEVPDDPFGEPAA